MLDRWLASAGLGHLCAAFEAQGIDQVDLKDLTDADLRELGLTIGERKRFRRTLEISTVSVASGEVRPLTLAFFDLVDSSALCERLEVEDMMELLRSYRERCCAEIAEYGGHVAHLFGDGILAYFGYPTAHENDSERAVRAALAIAATVPGLETPAGRPLAVRCGIATGRVVVTELFSGWAADRQTVTGSTANIAARLQALASDNGVVVAESVAVRVSHLFNLSPLPEQRLKGFAEPVRPWCVQSRRSLPGLQDDDFLTSVLVGRAPQREALERAWTMARAGHAQLALVHGEPGIGKTRLVRGFLAGLGAGDDPPAILRFHASALDEHSPLRPFLGFMRRRFGLTETSSDAEVAQAVTGLLLDPSAAEVMALSVLLAPPALRDGDPEPGPPEQRRVALAAIAALVAAEAGKRPLVIAVEDAHWLDASSQELLGRVIAEARDRPLMVVATSRGADHAELAELDPTIVHDIALGPLSPDEVMRMTAAIFGEEPVPQAVIATLVKRTDGVPLFIEELLRPLVRNTAATDWARLVGKAGRTDAVPETLSEALAARLDALGPDKQVAQVAAVLGRSVGVATLARVMGWTEARVEAKLEALCAVGIFRAEPDAAGSRYAFRHALVCDTAYNSLLRGERQRLHLAFVADLQATAPVFCAERPDVVAHHLAEGGQAVESLPFWLAAGRAAAARSALHEARHDLERGWAIAEALPLDPQVEETLLDFAALLGPVLFAICGPGSAESRKLYARAVELAEATQEGRPHFAVLWGWWRLSQDFRAKYERAGMLMRLARRRGEVEMLLQAHHCNWASAFHAGEFERCRSHVEQGLALYARADCDKRPWLFGNHDARVCAHGEFAQLLWMQGRLRSAAREAGAALVWAEREAHAGTLAHVHDLHLLHSYYRRDAAATRTWARRMIRLAEDSGMPEARARGHLFLGWAMAEDDDAGGGLQLFEAAYRRQRAVGTDEDMPVYVVMLAEILNRVGDHARALAELVEIGVELDRLGIRNWAPEVQRLIGTTRLRVDPGAVDAAAEAFAAAERIASAQGAAMLALRATLSWAEVAEGPERAARSAAVARFRAQVPEPDDGFDIRRADRHLRAVREHGGRLADVAT